MSETQQRRKPGRPFLGDEGMTKRVATRLTPKEYDEFLARCEARGMTLAAVLREQALSVIYAGSEVEQDRD